MFKPKTILYEIKPADKQEYITVMAVTDDRKLLILLETLIRVKQCYPFFVKPTRQEWKKYRNNLIELYKIKSEEYFDQVKKKIEDGEITPS